SVETYATAEDFLDQVAEKMPACLILDVRMPGMSGLELQNLLAADNRRIPIVFITAHEDEQARLTALGAGGVAFVQKPCHAWVLLDAGCGARSQSTEGNECSLSSRCRFPRFRQFPHRLPLPLPHPFPAPASSTPPIQQASTRQEKVLRKT